MKLTNETLGDLKNKNLPSMTFKNLKVKLNPVNEKDETYFKQKRILIRAINEYLKKFVRLENSKLGNKCILCGSYLGGLLGTFEWGLAHGEGHCRACGYPARAKHVIKFKLGELAVNQILQYHPRELKWQKKDKGGAMEFDGFFKSSDVGQCIRVSFFSKQMKKSPIMDFDDLRDQLNEMKEKQCVVCPNTFTGPGDFCSQYCMYKHFSIDDLIHERDDEIPKE